MKKHFLLLVMALMSLTGWAQTATIGEVAIGEYTYGGAALPDDAIVKDSEGAILTKDRHYEISKGAFSDEACETAVADLASLKADGTTKYYRLITGIGAYAGQKKAVWFKVAKADATITLKAALSKTYGEKDPAVGEYTITYKKGTSDEDITAQFEGTLAYTYEGTDAGEHPLTFSGISPKATGIGANFNLVTKDKITIRPLELASKDVTFTAWQKDVEYTGEAIVGVYTIKVGDKTLTAGTPDVAATSTTPAVAGTGDYYVDAVTNVKWAAGAVAENRPTIHFRGNYTGELTVAEGKGFKVTPAPLTVTVEDFKADYDNKDHAVLIDKEGSKPIETAGVKFVYSGFLGADIQPKKKSALISAFTAPAKVVYAGEAINAGEYALTISGGSAGEGNYEFKNYLPGKLIINKFKVELTSKSTSKQIGEKDPKFELNAEPVLVSPNDKLSGIDFTREEGETAGKFTITPVVTAAKVTRTESGKTTDVTANYEFVAAKTQGQLTITAAGIVISIKDASKKYGEVEPDEFEYTVIGLQEGDVLDKVTVTRDKAGTTAGEAVGAYLLTAVAPENPNKDKYASVTVVPAIFTIEKAELEITMPTQNVAKTTGKAADLKKDGITAKGINNTDDIKDLIGDPGFVPTSLDVTSDNTYNYGYSVSLTAAAQKNYKITKVNGVAVPETATTENPNTPTAAYGKLIVGAGKSEDLIFKTTDGDATATPAVPSDYSQIQAHAGETQTVTLTINPRNARKIPASTTHKWAAQTWNTMVLPFEVKVRDISSALGYAIVNVVDPENTTEGNVQFKLEMDKVPANTPFCVKTDAAVADDKPITFNNVKIVDGGEYPSVDAGMGYKFVGAYKTLTIDKTKSTYNFLRGDNAKWAHIGSTSANTWDVLPFDAYIELTAAAAARGVTFTFQELDGSYTAIKAITVENTSAEANAEGWYTLGGVKLNGAPSQKGVYINNGKKVVIK